MQEIKGAPMQPSKKYPVEKMYYASAVTDRLAGYNLKLIRGNNSTLEALRGKLIFIAVDAGKLD